MIAHRLCPITPTVAVLLASLAGACTSDDPSTDSGASNNNDPNSRAVLIRDGLTNTAWTLETVRLGGESYAPLPLDATWQLSFDATGSVNGRALCNAVGGNWTATDATLQINDWNEDGAYCEAIERIPSATRELLGQLLLTGESFTATVNGLQLTLSNTDSALVFSGRAQQDDETSVNHETLVRVGGFTRAGAFTPVVTDPAMLFKIYRDADSLRTDLASLPAEGQAWQSLPAIDFSQSLVIGYYLPLDSQVSSDAVIRGAYVSSAGLQIDIARFGPDIPDPALNEGNAACAAGDALTAPWTLARIDSVLDTVSVHEMRRAFCSGLPVSGPAQ